MQACNTLPTCEVKSDHVDENTCLLNKDAAVMEACATDPQQDLEYHDSGIHDQHQAAMLRQNDCKQIFAVICILTTVFFEQLFIVLFVENWLLERVAFPSIPHTEFIVTGVAIVSSLFGGLIADTKLGRFKTIIGAALFNIFACAFLGVFRVGEHIAKDVLFYAPLFLLPIGFSGMLVNIVPFGADQVSNIDRERVGKFFLLFFWVYAFGTLLGQIIGTVLLQQTYASFICYIISACSMIVAVAVFALGRNSYVTVPLLDSFVLDAWKILWSAVISRIRRQGARTVQVESWLDRSKRSFGGMFTDTKVEDVKLLLKLLPIFVPTVVYFAIRFTMSTMFIHQGIHMDLSPLKSKSISVLSLDAFQNLALIILIPVMDKFIFQILAHFEVRLTPLKKMGAGMLFAAASLFVAGVVEMERKKPIYGVFQQELYHSKVNASELSIFYQSPQYLLLGTADVLALVTGFEFAYVESPRYVHSFIIGILSAAITAGFCLAEVMQSAQKLCGYDRWFSKHESQEYSFFIMVGLTVVNFLVFAALSSKYRYQSIPTPIVRMGNFNLMDQRTL